MRHIKTRLILVSGLPGSGKSTCGRWISKRYGISYVDYDSVVQGFMSEIYDRFYRQKPYDEFCTLWRERCYESFWDVAADSLRAGVSIVASAPLTKESKQYDFFDVIKQKYGLECEVLSITFQISGQELFKRISHRNAKRDSEKLSNWDEYYKNQTQQVFWKPDYQIVYELHENFKTDERIEAFLNGELRK